MLSKSTVAATALIGAILGASCSAPWRGEEPDGEVNVAFTFEQNLIYLGTSVRIDNHHGRFLLGTATRRSVVDPAFPAGGRVLSLADRDSLRLQPVRLELQGVADVIVGADAWGRNAISIDYRAGLVIYQKRGIERSQMTTFRFRNEPMIWVQVDGRQVAAVVDTTSPDTLVLPASNHERGTAHVSVAGIDFGAIDVQYANVAQPRIGNRLLSRFLVSIDYGRRVVGLWRDPRTPM